MESQLGDRRPRRSFRLLRRELDAVDASGRARLGRLVVRALPRSLPGGAHARRRCRPLYEVRDRAAATVYARNRGRLTRTAASRLSDLLSELPSNLPSRFGCPDCPDGGLAYVTLAGDGAAQRVDYEYPNPPSDLAALDSFVKRVMAALEKCRETSDVALEPGCTPVNR